MGFVNTLPGPFEAVVYEKNTEAFVNGVVTQAWAEVGTFPAKFQRGSMAAAVVSDQFKADVAAILFVDPADLPSIDEKLYRLKIGGEYYSIIYIDNIENVSVEIPLKLWE